MRFAWVLPALLVVACQSTSEPSLERGPCLPVLDPCGDCMDHCLAAVLIAEERYAREPPAAGEMGVDPGRALRIAEHCVGDDCRSVYRPMEPRSCLAVCGGRRDFPTCVGQADACAPRAR